MDNIVFNIALHLPIEDIYNLCQSGELFKVLEQDKVLWEQLVKRDYGNAEKSAENTWRQFYYQLSEILGTNCIMDSTKVLVNALKKDYFDVFRFLLIVPYINPTLGGDCVLCYAARNNKKKAIELLLHDPRIDNGVKNNQAFLCAVKEGHTEIVHLFLVDGRSDPTQGSRISTNPSLAVAAINGHTQIVEMLLADSRVDPMTVSDIIFSQTNAGEYLQIIKLLVADGRIVTNTTFWSICRYGHMELATQLIADPRIDPGYNNNVAIDIACFYGQTQVVQLLLTDPRVDPSVRGNHAFSCVCVQGHSEIVRLLLADPRVDPIATLNPHCIIADASENGHTNVVELLLSDGRVDPSIYQSEALIRASGCGHTDVVQLLLADPRVDPGCFGVNRTGRSEALIRALENGHHKIVRMLLIALCKKCSQNFNRRVPIQSFIMQCPMCSGKEPLVCAECSCIFIENSPSGDICRQCNKIRRQLIDNTTPESHVHLGFKMHIIYMETDSERLLSIDLPLLKQFNNRHLNQNDGKITSGPLHYYERDGYTIKDARVVATRVDLGI